ncbi:MAG: amino acid ABC transporter permease [Candidatus Adiutrix sp.]
MNKAPQFNPPQLKSRPFATGDLGAMIFLIWLGFYLYRYITDDLKYNWQWAIIGQFLITVDGDGVFRAGPLLDGLFMTIKLSVWIVVAASTFGFALAISRLSSSLYLQLLARSVVESARNMPPVILVFIFFYFFGSQLLPWFQITSTINSWPPSVQVMIELFTAPPSRLAAFMSAILALTYYEAAYFAEIYRGAIISIDRGQWEACHCLGLSHWQKYRLVILPQALRRSLPQMAGQFISVVKETSIISVISLAELMFRGTELSTTTHRMLEVWLTVAGLYFLANFALSSLFRRFEL